MHRIDSALSQRGTYTFAALRDFFVVLCGTDEHKAGDWQRN